MIAAADAAAQTALLNAFTAALKGLVPASGGGTTNFLRADGVFAAPPGGGGGGSATTVEVDLGATAKTSGKFTITDASILTTSKVLAWQAPGPYTGKGTRPDEAEMQPVQVIAVEPAAGSAVVKWQTPFAVALDALRQAAQFPSSNAAMGLKGPQDFMPGPLRHIGKVRGNVKFSYMILS
jgi:hypothetical protein